MTLYQAIKVYTNEQARFEGKTLASAIVSYVQSLKLAARCVVYKGIGGCYENGEIATTRLVNASYDLPVIIEILLPKNEVQPVLDELSHMVKDGMVCLDPIQVVSYRIPSKAFSPHLLVRDIMSRNPSFVTPEVKVPQAVALLLERELKALPVVDEHSEVVGILTQRDLQERSGMPFRLGLFSQLPRTEQQHWLDTEKEKPVRIIMTAEPVTIEDTQRVSDAVHLMVQHELKRLPIIDAEKHLVGMLSRIDVFRSLSHFIEEQKSLGTDETYDGQERLVRDIHSRDMLSLPMHESVQSAIELMAGGKVQRAAVVDDDLRLVGLVTDTLLLSAIDRLDHKNRFIGFNASKKMEDILVQDIMLNNVVSIGEDETVEKTLEIMTLKGMKRIPVVDSEGHFGGMVRRDTLLMVLSHRL